MIKRKKLRGVNENKVNGIAEMRFFQKESALPSALWVKYFVHGSNKKRRKYSSWKNQTDKANHNPEGS